MRFSIVACLLMACLAVSCLAKDTESEYFANEVYDVCQNVSKGTPGGWSFLPRTDLEVKNKDVVKHAKAHLKKGTADIGYACKNKKVRLHKVQVACQQIVNGKNYEYGAIAIVSCEGGGGRMHTFTGKFRVPATGK